MLQGFYPMFYVYYRDHGGNMEAGASRGWRRKVSFQAKIFSWSGGRFESLFSHQDCILNRTSRHSFAASAHTSKSGAEARS